MIAHRAKNFKCRADGEAGRMGPPGGAARRGRQAPRRQSFRRGSRNMPERRDETPAGKKVKKMKTRVDNQWAEA
jgi:hypothetical protein